MNASTAKRTKRRARPAKKKTATTKKPSGKGWGKALLAGTLAIFDRIKNRKKKKRSAVKKPRARTSKKSRRAGTTPAD